MIEIKDLLSKWSGILLSEEVKLEAVSRIISEIIGVEIKKDQVKIKNSVIYLDIRPIYKNEIFLKQEKISAKLEEQFGKKIPKDIR
jgi:hypothetical protein